MSDWIDLTRKLAEGIPVYPGDPLFQARPFAEHAADGFRGTRLTFGSHVGTHLDAPFHYFVDGETLDSFSLDFFFGTAAVLDFTSTVAARSAVDFRRPATLDADDLAPFEPIFDAVPFVFLRTGWAARFGCADFYSAFPSLTPDAADWLADFPKFRILGLETPSLVAFPPSPNAAASPDFAPDAVLDSAKKRLFDAEFLPDVPPTSAAELAPRPDFPDDAPPLDELELCADAECHRILLGRRPPILILEGLVGLERLPAFAPPTEPETRVAFDAAQTVEIAAFPLLIDRSDGCPVRVAARLNAAD